MSRLSFLNPLTWFPSAQGGTPGPSDDFWYTPVGQLSLAGAAVNPDTAMRTAAVLACVRVVTETVAATPLILYRRLDDGGKERATDHPLYDLLHDNPNPWQTAFEFIEMMQGHLELRGNAFAQIVAGSHRAIDALIPLHPDRVRVIRLENGSIKYEVRSSTGQTQNFAAAEIFHLRGLSSDGINGLSTIALAREAIGASLAQQEYASRFFANDSTPRGVLEFPGKLKEEGFERMKKEWQASQTGGNRHKTALLEEGLKYTAIGVSNKDSQFLEARNATRIEIASVFRVPPHKIGDLSNAHFTNIEQQNIEFITDSIYPRVKRLESRISKDLIVPLGIGDTGEYFAEFLLDSQLRGDQKTRYECYALGRQWGFLSNNDVRRLENMNPIPDGDEYLNPMNMVPLGTPPQPAKTPNKGAESPDLGLQQKEVRLKEFALAAAERVVRKEVKALRNALTKANGDVAEFKKLAKEFYRGHGGYVAEAMCISTWAAGKYAVHAYGVIEAADVSVIDSIEAGNAGYLAELALGEKLEAKHRPIQVMVQPQTVHLNPQISVTAPVTIQPMKVDMTIEQAPGKRKVKLVRDKDNRVVSAEVES